MHKFYSEQKYYKYYSFTISVVFEHTFDTISGGHIDANLTTDQQDYLSKSFCSLVGISASLTFFTKVIADWHYTPYLTH